MLTRQHSEFVEMLRTSEGTLVKICLYFTACRDDFLDLYQDIVCTLWESWEDFRGESDLNTWVTRIALNVAGQKVRRSERLPQVALPPRQPARRQRAASAPPLSRSQAPA